MRSIDDFIVRLATALLRGVMAAGLAFVYVQFFVLSFAAAVVGTTTLAALIAAAKVGIFGG